MAQWETSLKEWDTSSPADMEPAEIAQVKRKLEAARVRLAREVPRSPIVRTWFLSLVAGVSLLAPAHAHPHPQPKLVVAIVIDQFRYDYLTRFRSEYTGGLKRLLIEGADFTNSRYRHYPPLPRSGTPRS